MSVLEPSMVKQKVQTEEEEEEEEEKEEEKEEGEEEDGEEEEESLLYSIASPLILPTSHLVAEIAFYSPNTASLLTSERSSSRMSKHAKAV